MGCGVVEVGMLECRMGCGVVEVGMMECRMGVGYSIGIVGL